MMKMILICTLMTLIMIKVNGQDSDTLSNTLSYQKTIAKIGRVEIYGWTSYTWFWHEESGIGININLNKKKIHSNKKINNISVLNYTKNKKNGFTILYCDCIHSYICNIWCCRCFQTNKPITR